MTAPRDDRESLRRGRAIVTLAATFAMLAAAAQIARNAYLRLALDTFSWMSRDDLWMAPLGFLAIFLSVALVVWVVGGVIPAMADQRAPLFFFAFLTALSALLHFSRLHPAAVLVLALGLARTATVALDGHPARLRWLRRTGVAIAGCLAIGAVVERQLRGPGEAMGSFTQGAPNVLVIILDTVRASAMSAFGGPTGTTPNLERLAREGVAFELAIAPSSWSLPSHASILTGVRSGALDVDMRRPFAEGEGTVPEAFRNMGYATGGFVANWIYASYESGLSRGFQHFEDYATSPKETLLHANLLQTAPARAIMRGHLRDALRKVATLDWRVAPEPLHDGRRAEEVVGGFDRWRQALHGRPWFAFLNLFDAHGDFRPPESSARWFPKKGRQNASQDYLRQVAHLDMVLGDLFERLRADGSLDRTLVVVTSDHGEKFGRHELRGHGNSLYIQLLHVPLIMRLPGTLPAGLRVRAPVSLTNLSRSLLETAGFANARFPGAPLVWPSFADAVDTMPVLSETNETDGSWRGPTDRGAMSSVIAGRYHYIRHADGLEELYDLDGDPYEEVDLAHAASSRAELARMRQRLVRLTSAPAIARTKAPASVTSAGRPLARTPAPSG